MYPSQAMLTQEKRSLLHQGMVIPAHPLALNRHRKLDERRQRALSRYYLDAGAGGLAIGVHTTQFAIREPHIGLYKPVLELAKEEMDRFCQSTNKTILRIAGVVGKTEAAIAEAQLALDLGYDAVLLGLTAFPRASRQEMIAHCKAIADIIPVIGFYLQTAVGGRYLDVDFWWEFAQIDNVIAIKIAPFNRYQTLDVIRGVIESGRADHIALYTGNDDAIVFDLLSEYELEYEGTTVKKRIVGGLLGHWSVWTQKAVSLLREIQNNPTGRSISQWTTLAHAVTDSNAAFFDSANNFRGCIVGLHEVLRRQGLLEGIWTLDEEEILTPAQSREIDRVYASYPELNDDAFVQANLDRWLS